MIERERKELRDRRGRYENRIDKAKEAKREGGKFE